MRFQCYVRASARNYIKYITFVIQVLSLFPHLNRITKLQEISAVRRKSINEPKQISKYICRIKAGHDNAINDKQDDDCQCNYSNIYLKFNN